MAEIIAYLRERSHVQVSSIALASNNLNLSAGGSIINAATAGSTAIMQAVNNLNLSTSSLVNQGVLASLTANVNIATAMNSTLTAALQNAVNINNTMGTIRALSGAVNIGNSSLGRNAILSILGGNISSPQVNINGGAGSVRAMLDSVAGALNVTGGSAQVGTTSGVLNIGNLNIDGDPTFFNQGDIQITGDITVQEKLVILASRNITSAGPPTRNHVTGANDASAVSRPRTGGKRSMRCWFWRAVIMPPSPTGAWRRAERAPPGALAPRR